MNLLTIAWKSLRQRRLASSLTALSIALGVMLMVLVLVIFGAVNSAFTQRSVGYDLIVGPKGSELQLVLSAVYRMQPPIENLPYPYLEQLRRDRRVVSAVPLAFGDVTEQGDFPIVGTTPEYFENDYMPGQKFLMRGQRIGKLFDAIIGAAVAREMAGIWVPAFRSSTVVRKAKMCTMKSSRSLPCSHLPVLPMIAPCS
ncbi:MAG UNVERIFIED_CONTAM: ABC transporter permease [Planctomycetaceae bacterium]|jgi:putative ABC transport system permease protein